LHRLESQHPVIRGLVGGTEVASEEVIRARVPVSKFMRQTEGNSGAYVLRGHALITEIKATREAVCSVMSTAVFNEKKKVG
jgi:hypothetical protein